MKYLIIFSGDKQFNINELKNFVAVHVNDLESLYKLTAELIKKKHSVFCLFKDTYLHTFNLKLSNIQYFSSHYGTYILGEINLEGK
ncbi:MAG: hypothetical protein ACYCSQ_06560 [bacterium]